MILKTGAAHTKELASTTMSTQYGYDHYRIEKRLLFVFFWILKSKVAAYDMDNEMDKYEGSQNMNKFGHEWYP